MNKVTDEQLTIAIAQTDIAWEDSAANLIKIKQYTRYAKELNSEMVVFPEAMFSGFSMNISEISVAPDAPEIQEVRQLAIDYDIAIVTSFFIRVVNKCGRPSPLFYNRVFLFFPDGKMEWQDKRHLFRPAGEAKQVKPADSRKIFTYKGFNILLLACYDLRFPVWCRNRQNEYDILIDIANWPTPRRNVWRTLLRSRAMENLSYVVGVNRIGTDNNNLNYSGDSAIIDSRGQTIVEVAPKTENIVSATLHKAPLLHLRNKFPVWMDADPFILDPSLPYPIL